MAAKIKETRKTGLARVLTPFAETFGLSRALALSVVLFVIVVLAVAIFWFFKSAPPRTLTITSGPVGSSFQNNAEKYRKILERDGVTLRIVPSQGSQENLKRLNDPAAGFDVGFVQGGIIGTNGLTSNSLVSLGSISYEPLLVFYRGAAPLGILSELNGKRLAIGPLGSGTRSLALTLLQLNGVDTNATTLVDHVSVDAAKALLDGSVDVVFLMGDSASTDVMRQLLHAPDIHLLDFTQADAYTRRISYLNKLEIPMGSIDFGKNIPAQDLYLIGPTVELLARPDLHPALSDLLLEAAREVHGGASLLKRKGEFPAPLEHEFPISNDANRFYKSGKTFLYRYLPFWLASLVNRTLVVFVPLVVVLVTTLRSIPALYKWRIRLLLYRRYRSLLALEKELPETPIKQSELLSRLDRIEQAVNSMKVPASFADQFYALRGHIQFVRHRLVETTPSR